MADTARQDHSGEHGRDVRADRAREVGCSATPSFAPRRTRRCPRASAAGWSATSRPPSTPARSGRGCGSRGSRSTVGSWCWRRGGFDALLPSARCGEPRTAAAVLELAAALKREVPARTAAQVRAILLASAGSAPSQRTLQRHFVRLELNTRPDGLPPRAFGRFEAAARNERWTGDALHGPTIGGRKTTCSRSSTTTVARWSVTGGATAGHRPPRSGPAGGPGIPRCSAGRVSRQRLRDGLLAAVAGPGDPGDHPHPSKPGEPAGRGKIERFFRTVREQFLVELAVPGALAAVGDLVRLNELFTGWVENRLPRTGAQRDRSAAAGTVPGRRPTRPADRAAAARGVLVVTPAESDQDRDDQPARQPLRGRRRAGRSHGRGRVRPIRPRHARGPLPGPVDGDRGPAPDRRHVHPDARPDLGAPPACATGIDYLALVAAGHRAELAARINYTDLPTNHPDEGPVEGPDEGPVESNEIDERLEAELASFAALRHQHADGELPGQLDLTELADELAHDEDAHSQDRQR